MAWDIVLIGAFAGVLMIAAVAGIGWVLQDLASQSRKRDSGIQPGSVPGFIGPQPPR
ncbi:MAG TPA: hypothetical protein VJ805_05120 [Nitrospiraceae bacterium]|nr:hypothetical protein [Nitrospiraceae bacterium]